MLTKKKLSKNKGELSIYEVNVCGLPLYGLPSVCSVSNYNQTPLAFATLCGQSGTAELFRRWGINIIYKTLNDIHLGHVPGQRPCLLIGLWLWHLTAQDTLTSVVLCTMCGVVM